MANVGTVMSDLVSSTAKSKSSHGLALRYDWRGSSDMQKKNILIFLRGPPSCTAISVDHSWILILAASAAMGRS